ncbi:hypothetical protein X992_5332 [Burkholderia pseudomallei MSHR5492]|nr:hypothetical protein X992_5332 [Burkholderia pseudomallei MSHR5492]
MSRMYTGLLDNTPRGERVTGAFLRSMAVYFPSLTLHNTDDTHRLVCMQHKIKPNGKYWRSIA